jgi:hypothetical protein
MKRSEIVNKLVETMGSYDSWEEQCNYMLQICEDQGMRPPLWDNYNPTQQERTFSRDSDWNYHGEREDGTKIYSLECGYWEKE